MKAKIFLKNKDVHPEELAILIFQKIIDLQASDGLL